MEIPLKLLLAGVSALFEFGAYATYVRGMFRGHTRPHAYSWLVWTLTQGTALAALWYGGGGWGALGLVVGTILAFSIFLLSFRHGTKNITRGDTVVLAIALGAILVWWKLDSPLAAVLMVTGIDMFGYIPSIRKSIIDPWSETISTWAIFFISDLFSLLALSEYNLLTMTYLTLITAANIVLISVCLIGRAYVREPA